MEHETVLPSTMDRREMLRRAAVVSGAGAIAWAAPSIATVGIRAAASTPGGEWKFSWIAFIIDTADGRIRMKANRDSPAENETLELEWDDGGVTPDCTEFSDGTSASATGPPGKEGYPALDPVPSPGSNLSFARSGSDLVVTINDNSTTGSWVFTAFATFQGGTSSCSSDPTTVADIENAKTLRFLNLFV
ncbi:MAG: hypothetical protein JJT89_01015 [Nitriliruptoraceae bacterium]|nr:hypothetical protein [Nitriliruptoraceae bacterium]